MSVLQSSASVGWVGTWLLTVPTLSALTADKVRSKPLLSMSKLLTLVAPHGVGNVWTNRKPIIPDMEVCMQRGHFECQKDDMQKERFVVLLYN
jgi:hypothetical protein